MASLQTTTIAEAAKRLDTNIETVRRWCIKRKFGVRIMGRWRVPVANVERLEQRLKEAAAQADHESLGW